MANLHRWKKEPGFRVRGTDDLDRSKVQAPGVVRRPGGGFRLFYTGIGPGRPFTQCQGYILSAVSDDGITFDKEPGIRVAPQPAVRHKSRRILAPSMTQFAPGLWRMYFEARGPAGLPTTVCSAVSEDLLNWVHEDGIRLTSEHGVGAPRYLAMPDGGGRMYCFRRELVAGSDRQRQSVAVARSSNGLDFELLPGSCLKNDQAPADEIGVTAAEAVPPAAPGDAWTMFFSAWQDVPPGTAVPLHPSHDPNPAEETDFAAASIACDMAGYRSRVYTASSSDGLEWERGGCVIDGAGYGGDGEDAVHAEDMAVIRLDDGRYRMYYACCNKDGEWGVTSAVTEG